MHSWPSATEAADIMDTLADEARDYVSYVVSWANCLATSADGFGREVLDV
jgi:hypothetical protein